MHTHIIERAHTHTFTHIKHTHTHTHTYMHTLYSTLRTSEALVSPTERGMVTAL